MKWHTELVHFDPAPGDPHAPSTTPLYQTATFRQPSATEAGGYDYSRSGNPTRAVLEARLAHLEGGHRGFAFASGMAAIDAVVSLLPAGGSVVAGTDLYGGTFRYLDGLARGRGITVRFADTTRERALEAAVASVPEPLLVLVETPSNPRMTITDIAAAARLSHRRGGLLAVDNSLMSPYLQRPLGLGADLVVHSATKFLSGHGHTTAGAVISRDDALSERIAWHQNAAGTALAPFDCWLLIAGIKTLALRLDRQQASARRLAARLDEHPAVEAVSYPGLASHPGADRHDAQAAGPGSVLSLRLASARLARRLVEDTRLFQIAVSFGGVGSSIELPARMSHTPVAARHRWLDERWVRIAVGIEDAEDLEADLMAALAGARAAERRNATRRRTGR